MRQSRAPYYNIADIRFLEWQIENGNKIDVGYWGDSNPFDDAKIALMVPLRDNAFVPVLYDPINKKVTQGLETEAVHQIDGKMVYLSYTQRDCLKNYGVIPVVSEIERQIKSGEAEYQGPGPDKPHQRDIFVVQVENPKTKGSTGLPMIYDFQQGKIFGLLLPWHMERLESYQERVLTETKEATRRDDIGMKDIYDLQQQVRYGKARKICDRGQDADDDWAYYRGKLKGADVCFLYRDSGARVGPAVTQEELSRAMARSHANDAGREPVPVPATPVTPEFRRRSSSQLAAPVVEYKDPVRHATVGNKVFRRVEKP